MLEAFGLTDVGRRRKLNEDNFIVDRETNLFAVCDGMGGHTAGVVASRMAIETLTSFISRSHREKEITWPYGLDVNLSFDGNRIKTAIKLANKRVFKAADNRDEYTGMGTTVVLSVVTGDVMTVGSAGDSRAYLLRDGEVLRSQLDEVLKRTREQFTGEQVDSLFEMINRVALVDGAASTRQVEFITALRRQLTTAQAETTDWG